MSGPLDSALGGSSVVGLCRFSSFLLVALGFIHLETDTKGQVGILRKHLAPCASVWLPVESQT